MNYLAHIFLSREDDFIKIGNFIADGIKGTKYKMYPNNVQIGILLHRQIDSFTDSNAIVRTSKNRLDKRYGHYRGVIIDILYDHFLAKNWSNYSNIPLKKYTHTFYKSLEDNAEILPQQILYMMPYMIKNDWITNYATLEGIERVLIGMNKRTKEKSKMNLAINDLKEHYMDLENDFTLFFKELHKFSEAKLIEIEKEF